MGPYTFLSNGITGSLTLSHDFEYRDRGRRSITVKFCRDYEASSMITGVHADIASLTCLAYPWNCKILINTLTTVTCDAEDLCSVNTVLESASSFTTSSRSVTRPLYFQCKSINVAKWTVFPSICVSPKTFFLWTLSTFCTTGLSRPGVERESCVMVLLWWFLQHLSLCQVISSSYRRYQRLTEIFDFLNDLHVRFVFKRRISLLMQHRGAFLQIQLSKRKTLHKFQVVYLSPILISST